MLPRLLTNFFTQLILLPHLLSIFLKLFCHRTQLSTGYAAQLTTERSSGKEKLLNHSSFTKKVFSSHHFSPILTFQKSTPISSKQVNMDSISLLTSASSNSSLHFSFHFFNLNSSQPLPCDNSRSSSKLGILILEMEFFHQHMIYKTSKFSNMI